MPNPNYNRGRRFEYQLKMELENEGAIVFRTAGSHGKYDLIAITKTGSVCLIQAKTLKQGTKRQAETMVKKFMKNPPLPKCTQYVQVLVVYAMKDRARVEGSL